MIAAFAGHDALTCDHLGPKRLVMNWSRTTRESLPSEANIMDRRISPDFLFSKNIKREESRICLVPEDMCSRFAFRWPPWMDCASA